MVTTIGTHGVYVNKENEHFSLLSSRCPQNFEFGQFRLYQEKMRDSIFSWLYQIF